MTDDLKTWRCFHCDKVFADAAAAELHFGRSEYDRAFCTIDAAHFRWMEAQHRRNADNDSEALRTVRTLVSEHETLRRRAEEIGYSRGLTDARRHPADIGLVDLKVVTEAAMLLDVIAAEFSSDPMSVQCFDLRVVKRVKDCADALKRGKMLS